MGTVCWKLQHEDNKHVIKLKHNTFLGNSLVYFDDKKILKKRAFLGEEKKHSLSLEGQECTLSIIPRGLEYDYSFEMNGQVLPLLKEEEKLPVEWWMWCFVIACAIIPIVFIESLIVWAIGFGGAYKCISVARKRGEDKKTRILYCVRTTVLSWVYFGIFYLIITKITDYFLKIYM